MTIDPTSLTLRFPRIDPMSAEVHVFVPSTDAESTEVKGRVLGPRCRFATTVEVASPLQRRTASGAVFLAGTIPEPSLWDPESPFLYQAIVEWRPEGQPVQVLKRTF